MIPTLHAGGAERIMSFIAQNLDKNKFNTILIVVGLENESKYKVDNCEIIFLNKTRVRNGVLAIIKQILKRKPQIVFSSIGDLNIIMGYISLFFPRVMFVGRRAAISGILRHLEGYKHKKRKKLFLDYRSFGIKKLDYHICQSEDMKKNLINTHGIDSNRITVINNPITQPNKIEYIKHKNNVKKFITIGRLSMGKGYIRLLNNLSKLKFSFQYTIIGDGPYHKEIFDKVRELELDNQVNYIKFTNKVLEHLVKHDMFLQGSYTEGFPNALLESCSVGTPVIAYDVPGGTKEIVENDINGFLVNSDEEFIEKLNYNKEWDTESIIASVKNKFDKNIIIKQYEDFFQNILL